MKLYRFHEQQWSSGWDDEGDNFHRSIVPKVTLEKYVYDVKRETPKGCWIVTHYGLEKWVSNNTTKRYAYPTRAQALNGFIARKRKQIEILTKNLKVAKIALDLGTGMKGH